MITLLPLAILQVTIAHTFVYEAAKGHKSVHVAGTFNGWNKDADPMVPVPNTRQWTLTKRLNPGKHHYKFVLDGSEWLPDPKAKSEDDGNGNINSILLIEAGEFKDPASRADDKLSKGLIEHSFASPYLQYDRGALTLGIRLRKNDAKTVALAVKGQKPIPMKLVESDDFYEWYRGSLAWPAKKAIGYSFEVVSGNRKFVVGPYGLTGMVIQPRDIPSWPESSVVYQIFPDRFANGSKTNDPADVMPWDGKPAWYNWFGGDAAGTLEKVPYLKSLGVKAVYFNPLFKSPSNHRYETSDYHKVDERFGTNAEFAHLTRVLKQNGIRTVLDGVYNHTATDFAPFADLIKYGEKSAYKGWYYPKSFPIKVGNPPNYEAWFGFPSMPKINTMYPAATQYLASVPAFWDKEAEIAGWRLDVANEVSMDFWRIFRKRVKALGRDRWIIGEIWGDGSQWLKGDQWDSIMGYQFRDAVLRFIAEERISPSQYFEQLMKVHRSYHPAVSRNLMILLGSHDTPRILTVCKNDKKAAMLAATLQLTWVGAPSIYYGDELGMEGDRDPDNRRGMEWGKATPDNPFLKHYRALIAARNSSKALQSGDPILIQANDSASTLVYGRQLGESRAVVAVNRSKQERAISVNIPFGETRWTDVLSNRVIPAARRILQMKLPPQSGAVLLPVGGK